MTDSTPYGKRRASVEFWARSRNSIGELYPSEKHFFLDRLPDCVSVLDVGCAAGGFSQACREVVPDIRYRGLDVSQNLVERASQQYADAHTAFSIYDGREFPADIRDAGYDMVYSFGVLHHVPHWERVVQQMVAASGKFVCFDLRLSFEGGTAGHQIIDFDEEWDGETKIDYIVVEFFDALKKIREAAGDSSRVSLYGYECPPTSKARVDREKVVMASFCVDKNYEGRVLQVEVS